MYLRFVVVEYEVLFFWLLTLDRPLDCSDVGFLSSFLFYPLDVKAHGMTLWRCLLPLPPSLVGR